MTTQTETPNLSPIKGRMRSQSASEMWLQRFKTLAPVWTLIALGVVFTIASPNFMRWNNIHNILAQMATLAIFGTGMTFVLLTGEIDLSIAAVAALSAIVAAHLYSNLDYPEPIPTLAAVSVATLLGLIGGIASTRFRIPTFMTTLALSLIASGLTTYISKGRTITSGSEIVAFIGSARLGGTDGLRMIIVLASISLFIGHIILRYTRFGRYVYMTGASKSAARLAGVNTNVIITATMTISGFTAGIAGIVSMARLGSALPDAVPSYLIETLAAVVLGGTALTGGRGGILQTVIGLLIYGTLRNGLDNIASIDTYLKEFITGVVLLIALVVNIVFSGKADRDKTG
jgi:ribose transport system permease protein